MGMDFLAIRTKQHSCCLFRSRTCYGRISLHMHQLSGTCGYHITPDTEHLCRFGTKWWPALVLAMGTLSILWGLWILTDIDPDKSSIGYIMIGLGLVCYSISSKVILLAVIWRNVFKLANRIPLIPVLTALTCLFLSAFMFEMATLDDVYFVPARVLAGLGGICFTLFSIVSILESGTSN